MPELHAPQSTEGDSSPVKLETLEIFRGVGAPTLDSIGRRAQRRTLSKGELLFN